MYGQTCIFWADLTPFSLEAAAAAEKLYAGALVRGASWAALSVEERRAVAFFDVAEDGYEEQLLEMLADGDPQMAGLTAAAENAPAAGPAAAPAPEPESAGYHFNPCAAARGGELTEEQQTYLDVIDELSEAELRVVMEEQGLAHAAGDDSPGRYCHSTLSLTVIGWHSLGIHLVILR
jgi:hypothetical protein